MFGQVEARGCVSIQLPRCRKEMGRSGSGGALVRGL